MQYNTLIIGSGCAGFNAADCLYDLGVKNIALITEGINMGTSRNTGSDKQTYYKLTLAGEEPDSVYEMARTLFDGGAVHGDIALTEAACSATAFMKLVQLGLPFPANRYGAFVGYKTDHDPRQRATSCGPLTSKLMTEALENSVNSKGITILDNSQVVKLLTSDNQIRGLVLLKDGEYQTLYAQNIILATGGPAGIYHNVVYPASQTGGTGLALDAGAMAVNLQEWQYGLASIDFRWNVSGTYQQVLPRYISIDEDGKEHEFLPDYFDNPIEALDMVFLKGYQWPFDTLKVGGSSRVDLAVAAETGEKGRKVYMDFRQNPIGLDFAKLAPETYDYLKNSDALFGTPIERLAKMNPKAIDLYKNNGIDIFKEPLRVAVCAQHCNGGIAVDANWESSVKGLYVVGEAAGTFGVYRPGGSALNSTQVGAMRAAESVFRKTSKKNKIVDEPIKFNPSAVVGEYEQIYNREETCQAMSLHAAYVRNSDEMKKLHTKLCQLRDNFFEENSVQSKAALPQLYKNYDILLTQIAILSAMIFSAKNIGTRGGALVDSHMQSDEKHMDKVINTHHNGESYFEQVRPLPPCDDWFEKVWAERENRI